MAVTLASNDQALVDEFQKQYATAQAAGNTAGMTAAHTGAEGIRSKYGYSGGVAGDEWNRLTAEGYNSAEDYINEITRQQNAAVEANLKASYDKNVSNVNAQLAALPAVYNDARNKTASQSEVQKASFNEYAAANGLNSGAGGQAQLSFSNSLQGNLSELDKAQAGETSKYNLQLTQLASDYQNALQQAFAQGNINRAQALYESYQTNKANLQAMQETDYNRKLANAQILAQYGDFSGFAALGYTPEQVAKMTSTWNKANAPKTPTRRSSGGGSGGGNYSPTRTLDDMPTHSKEYAAVERTARNRMEGTVPQVAVNFLAEAVDRGAITRDEAATIMKNIGIA